MLFRSDDVDRVVAPALREVGADHAIRLGRADVRRGWFGLPGGGPLLTWRGANHVGMPPAPNWSLSMGDVELF